MLVEHPEGHVPPRAGKRPREHLKRVEESKHGNVGIYDDIRPHPGESFVDIIRAAAHYSTV